jgi:gamma-glutamyltranspeptidase/glutathione hydrolase
MQGKLPPAKTGDIMLDATESWIDCDPTRTRPARGIAACAAANPLAARAGVAMLHQGGSAVDAAIAAQLVLNVVEPNASGIGGGAVIMVHVDGVTLAIDGLSAAPARVTDRLERDFDGRAIPPDRACFGGRTVGVPGALRAMELAHQRFGKLAWSALFEPARELAEAGFPLAPYLTRALLEMPSIRDEPFTRAIHCAGGPLPPPLGTMLRNPELARSLRLLADGGAGVMYEGELADAVCRAVQADLVPGTLTRADMAAYRVELREPVRFPLGAFTVETGPLPAMGGVAIGQIIGILSRLGLSSLGEDLCEDEVHRLAEAGRIAFADRPLHGDPAFGTADPAALLDGAYLDARARLFDPARRTDKLPQGTPDDALGGSMTSHISVRDTHGGWVAMTTTINQNFGARLAVGGFYLNNVLTNFAADPLSRGRRVANAMAPGKRPRTTIAPSLVFDAQGQPIAAVGAGGGYRIIGYVANALLRLAGGARDPQGILSAPHALNWSGITELEPPLARHAKGLAARGHWVTSRRMDGGTQCVLLHDGAVLAGGDPRRDGLGMALR